MSAFTEIARDIGGDHFNAGDPRGLRRGHAVGGYSPVPVDLVALPDPRCSWSHRCRALSISMTGDYAALPIHVS